MYLAIAAVIFAIYVTNVVLGAITNNPIFNDVTEMVILFVAAGFFTVAILKSEAAEQNKKDRNP